MQEKENELKAKNNNISQITNNLLEEDGNMMQIRIYYEETINFMIKN